MRVSVTSREWLTRQSLQAYVGSRYQLAGCASRSACNLFPTRLTKEGGSIVFHVEPFGSLGLSGMGSAKRMPARGAQLSLSHLMTSAVPATRMSLEEQVSLWFRQWREPICRYLIAAGGEPASAEEITQESFLRLYRALYEGKSINNPRSWLYRVAHNLLVDQARSKDYQNAPLLEVTETALESLFDTRPSAERIAMDRERLFRVHQAMLSLTEMQRNCLYLRAEGFLNREIAQILEVGMSSVADALRRAIKRIAQDRHD